MKYFICAGETSGDLHAANLAKELFHFDEKAIIQAWGGSKLEQAGVTVTKDYKELAIMGFVEIITKLPKIFSNLRQAVREIMDFNPDCVILVDFSGFNLRLAERLRKANYQGKIFYYISPKLWVWNQKRVKKFKKWIDAVFCILPFEVEFYKQHNYHHSYYIGNPIMDEISSFSPNKNFISQNNLPHKPLIALLPGSRSNEVQQIFPKMLEVVSNFPDFQFVVAATERMMDEILELQDKQHISLPIVVDQTYDLLVHSKASLVTSGTATLETALLGTPLVLCYKGNALSFRIAKALVSIKYIGLPNLIVDKEMVKELIQNDLTKENQTEELNRLLFDENRKQEFTSDVEKLKTQVGPSGASKRAAEKMIELLNETHIL